MNRITDPRKERYTGNTQKGWKKLQQLEDIEQELGCELVVIYKAIKNGICFGNVEKKRLDSYPHLDNLEGWVLDNGLKMVKTEDYGKTWVLPKEVQK